MSKKREAHANWFTLPYDDRSSLMHEHGASGRKFAGRVLQVVTGSAGLDNYEWGVTLFAVNPDGFKLVPTAAACKLFVDHLIGVNQLTQTKQKSQAESQRGQQRQGKKKSSAK